MAGPDAGLGEEPCALSCSQDVDPGDSDASDTIDTEDGAIRVIRCSRRRCPGLNGRRCSALRALQKQADIPPSRTRTSVFAVPDTRYTRTHFSNHLVSSKLITSCRLGTSGSSSSGGGTTRQQPSEDVSVHVLGPLASRGRCGSCGRRLRSPGEVFCVGCDMPVRSTVSGAARGRCCGGFCNHCLDVHRAVSGLCQEIQYGDVSALPAETMLLVLFVLLLLLWHLLLLTLLRATFRF